MAIYVLVVGGLGNQLFTIFTGIAYFIEHKIPFKLVSYEKRRPFYYNTFLSNLKKFVTTPDWQFRRIKSYVEPNFHYNKIPYNDNFIFHFADKNKPWNYPENFKGRQYRRKFHYLWYSAKNYIHQ